MITTTNNLITLLSSISSFDETLMTSSYLVCISDPIDSNYLDYFGFSSSLPFSVASGEVNLEDVVDDVIDPLIDNVQPGVYLYCFNDVTDMSSAFSLAEDICKSVVRSSETPLPDYIFKVDGEDNYVIAWLTK